MEETNLLCYIANSPGKGTGLFASREIEKGMRVISDAPSMVVTSPTPIKIYQTLRTSSNSDRSMFKHLVHGIPAESLQHFKAELSLENAGSDPSSKNRVIKDLDYDRGAEDVAAYYKSCLRMGPPENDQSAIFFTVARLNHSCMPNCYALWNPVTETMCVHAIRDIQKDHELTIAYDEHISLQEDNDTRARDLKRRSGFDCDCWLCDRSTNTNGPARDRRDAIVDTLRKIDNYPQVPAELPIRSMYEDVVEMLHDLEMETMAAANLHEQLASIYEGQGHNLHASIEIKLAQRIASICLGADHPGFTRLVSLRDEMRDKIAKARGYYLGTLA